VKYLKIDGSFIRNLCADPTDQHHRAFDGGVGIGLNKDVVAEFVPDWETAALLLTFGVNYVQGYGIGEPLPVASVFARKAA